MYMKKALELAIKGTGTVSPNPLVGAVVVKDGKIIGQGYHQQAGGPHAEVYALDEAGKDAAGATLYVTLEPCSHYGKTPPCAKRIIEAGITRVVVGIVDPNPLVAHKGIDMLEEAHIKVDVGILADECAQSNEIFLTYVQTKLPFVTIKSAMSLDGKIATYTGESKWITNEEARLDGHQLRAQHDVILTGIGTILADNPSLNCRLPIDEEQLKLIQPDVVVLDSMGRTPVTSTIFSIPNRQVIIMVTDSCADDRKRELKKAGAKIIVLSSLTISNVLEKLGALKYTSILVEGGSRIIGSFIEEKKVDKIVTYLGNLIIGGEKAILAIGGQGFSSLANALPLAFKEIKRVGNNIKIEAYYTERKGIYVYGNY